MMTETKSIVTSGYAALWHGGASYGPSHISDHLEFFPSLQHAKAALQKRKNHGYSWKMKSRKLTHNENGTLSFGETEFDLMPCVDENSYLDITHIRNDGSYDFDSFTRIEFGPRGGIQTHHC